MRSNAASLLFIAVGAQPSFTDNAAPLISDRSDRSKASVSATTPVNSILPAPSQWPHLIITFLM
jgi:hypothetical protein